eukprot:TRINITY_DN76218_c0_g1_i1.p1 TRINITY_DN76218_c0_g1~~TRINITY_DN76218_c0_g1_i1.p1  ORF type:complete len:610 (+),score=105.65 TRINITY_DN76218_c0_g1_i1:76-1830(+)
MATSELLMEVIAPLPWRDVPGLWWKILRLYFSLIFRFAEVHPDLPDGSFLTRVDQEARQQPVDISLPTAFAEDFNRRFTELTSWLLSELKAPNFQTMLAASFAVRALQCLAVFSAGWHVGLTMGLLQFVVAPLSLTGSFIRLLTNVSDCVLHYSCSALAALALAGATLLLKAATGAYLTLPTVTITIGSRFLLAFFSIDFILNVVVHLNTSESFGLRRMAVHVIYGTFNTKTYFLVVLGCLLQYQLDIGLLLLASGLTMAARKYGVFDRALKLLGWPCFSVCFYVEHRIGHLPIVYQNAHKMHHYLHDSTAFDAHVYGSGMNEEFFWILAETLPCLLFPALFFPYFLNLETLWSSWTNKGAHTRTADGVGLETFGCFDEDNFHADHHTLHRANYGSSLGVLLDFYFGTEGSGTRGSTGLVYIRKAGVDGASTIDLRIERAVGENRAPRVPTPDQEDEKHGLPGPCTSSLRVVSKQELASKSSVEAGGIWIALNGAVFDLTKFHVAHPGGSHVILRHAGTDASSVFAEIGHSPQAKAMAAKRLIGHLEGQAPNGFVAELLAEATPATKGPGMREGLGTPLLSSAA